MARSFEIIVGFDVNRTPHSVLVSNLREVDIVLDVLNSCNVEMTSIAVLPNKAK